MGFIRLFFGGGKGLVASMDHYSDGGNGEGGGMGV